MTDETNTFLTFRGIIFLPIPFAPSYTNTKCFVTKLDVYDYCLVGKIY